METDLRRWMRLVETEAEHDMPTGERDPAAPVYLRIGAWNPANPISRNYAKGDIESGLSVYDLDNSGQPVVPDEAEWAATDMHERLRSNDPKFLVQGQYCGEGHDGEPLLSKVVVVGMWPQDFSSSGQV
jgi:hypothetical protein